MKSYENNFNINILLVVLWVTILMACGCWELAQIKNILQTQFDYQIEMQFCMQDAMEYHAPCRLEMDTDGSVHWYFNANEGRM